MTRDPNIGDRLEVVAVGSEAVYVGRTVTLASGALLTLQADGSYLYDPNGRFDWLNEGERAFDNFTYTVADQLGATSSAEVTVTVLGANSVPITSPVDGRVRADTPVHVPAQDGVLANDRDPDAGARLTVAAVNGVAANVGRIIDLPSAPGWC